MIAPTSVMIESILFSPSSISLGLDDGSAIRFWKFVFCYVFDEGFWNNWIVFEFQNLSEFHDSSSLWLYYYSKNPENFMFLDGLARIFLIFSRVSDVAEQRILKSGFS
ncbi:hypothetical protein SO802_010515 [Lithocarpus litseifolius]|uniref:Maturase K n=1 Tax=Lithocarpus litseifolius TaxID=425828 RepID=A0AAW2DH32_9ROSI